MDQWAIMTPDSPLKSERIPHDPDKYEGHRNSLETTRTHARPHATLWDPAGILDAAIGHVTSSATQMNPQDTHRHTCRHIRGLEQNHPTPSSHPQHPVYTQQDQDLLWQEWTSTESHAPRGTCGARQRRWTRGLKRDSHHHKHTWPCLSP